MAELKIRPIKRGDLNALAEAYTKAYETFDVDENWTMDSAYKLLAYWLKRQPDLCFLAEYDKNIIGGFVAGVKPWWDGNHLVDGEVFVHPNYQKKGIGSALSKHIYKIALEKYHVVRFDTYTFKMTKFPLEWYKSQGFEEIKEWVMISADLNKVLERL